jgi:hypothetical protein
MENLNISNPNSPITIYIQHPIPIPAPDENKVALRPMMLTTKAGFFFFLFRQFCGLLTAYLFVGAKEDEETQEETRIAG